MKKTTLFTTLLVLIALITACTPQAQATEEVAILTVNEASYTQSGLEALRHHFCGLHRQRRRRHHL